GDRTGSPAAAARRDAAAGPGLAGDVRGTGRGGPVALPAAGPVPSARAVRSRVLVERLALPRPRVRPDGAQYRAGRGNAYVTRTGGTRGVALSDASRGGRVAAA